jgi:antitoxin component of MazEF toxin-antitoxin module
MTTTIKKWGDSAALRIPHEILAQASLTEGSDVEIMFADERKEITIKAVKKRKIMREIFEGYTGEYLTTKELDWGEPQGDEVW